MKPGYLTTEFYLTIAGMVVPQLMTALPPIWQAAIPAFAAGCYAIARGLAKLGMVQQASIDMVATMAEKIGLHLGSL